MIQTSLAIGDPCKILSAVLETILEGCVSTYNESGQDIFIVKEQLAIWKSGIGSFPVYYGGNKVGTVTSESGFLVVLDGADLREHGFFVHEMPMVTNMDDKAELMRQICDFSVNSDYTVLFGEIFVMKRETEPPPPPNYMFSVVSKDQPSKLFYSSVGAILYTMMGKEAIDDLEYKGKKCNVYDIYKDLYKLPKDSEVTLGYLPMNETTPTDIYTIRVLTHPRPKNWFLIRGRHYSYILVTTFCVSLIVSLGYVASSVLGYFY